MAAQRRIVAVDEVPADTTHLFTLRETDSGEEREAILVRSDDTITAWLNYCQHYTHVNIDKGSGAEMRDGELLCTNHGAYFEAETGCCTYGPCEGAYLPDVDVTIDDGAVHLVDEAYEYVRGGGIETADEDLESKSNYKF